jgi:hypothetical protein
MGKRCAERPHFAFGFISRFQESRPFGRRQGFAVSAVVAKVRRAADFSRLERFGGDRSNAALTGGRTDLPELFTSPLHCLTMG